MLKNRRNHKERSQLAHRTKLGILEKHKDYVKRAQDYHSKQNRLNRLRQKAAERNKDEFYFSMIKERSKHGVHVHSRGNAALPIDIVKVLKTQDENYARTMRASGLKKIEKIKSQLTENFIEGGDDDLDQHQIEILKEAKIFGDSSSRTKPNHILFATSPEEASLLSKKGKEKAIVNIQSPVQDEVMDLGWKSTKPIVSKVVKSTQIQRPDVDNESRQQQLDKRKRLLKELAARLDRSRKLGYAQREFEMQRLMMGKGARKKIQAVQRAGDDQEEDQDEIDSRRGKRRSAPSMNEEVYRPRVYKWRLERKK